MGLRLMFKKFAQARAQELTDETGLHRFARAMSWKLEKARNSGRAGWDSPLQVGTDELAQMLVQEVAKGDPVDIANFCMFLHQRDPLNAHALIRQALVNHVVTEVVPHIRELTASKQG